MADQPRVGRGIFVVFEGGDCSGKSTQVAWLAAALEQAGVPHVVTFEPGGTWLGQRLRALVLDPESGAISPRAEALLYVADKAQHVREVVQPGLDAGMVVVSDRYTDSVIAYQGAGRELRIDEVERLAIWATGELRPDLTVLLDADPAQAVATIERKDRLEGAGLRLHERARAEFLRLAARDPQRYLVLPARHPRAELARAVRERLAGFGLELSEPSAMLDADDEERG